MTQRELIQRNCVSFRKEAGLTQERVAQEADVSIDAVRAWEQGRRSPDRDNLAALARLYHRSMDDFFQESPPPPKAAVEEPLFALKADPRAPEEMRRRAEEYLRNLNREYFDKVATEKAKRKKK